MSNPPHKKAGVFSNEIFAIAGALSYKKIDRLRQAENVTDDVLIDVLQASITEPYAILFFPGRLLQITPFGTSLSHAGSRTDKNYLIAFPELDEKFLRQAFTGLELVLYKICHIALEAKRPDYHWESETSRQRFRRLGPLLPNVDWAELYLLFDRIFFVRDAFAHSFIDLPELKYNGVPLELCFGDSFIGFERRDAEATGARIFTDDLALLFDPIADLFSGHQLKQIDVAKFHKLCDRLLMSRSLSPGP